MTVIRKQYIVDEEDRKVAVQLDMKTFEKIEEILENYALVQLMEENEGDSALGLKEAKMYYQQLEKAS
jgi:hypothetical protein